MLQFIADNKVVDVKRIQYSDGAIGFDLGDFPINTKSVVISVDPNFKISGLLDEMTQLIATLSDLTERKFTTSLYIPYMPYARNDRKFTSYSNFGLNNFIEALEGFGVTEVVTVDPHNQHVLEDLCKMRLIELEYMTQLQAFSQTIKRERLTPQNEWDIVIAPDKGAKAKAKTIADYYGLPLVCCTKERDPATGKLSNPVVNGDVSGKRVLIVDDLLDNGGTYIQLAQELYKQGVTFTDLYVTHLIAAKGLNVLTNSIRKLYTYHTCCGYVTMQDVQKFNKGEI